MSIFTHQDEISIRLSVQAQAESRLLNDFIWAYNRIFGNDQSSVLRNDEIMQGPSSKIISGPEFLSDISLEGMPENRMPEKEHQPEEPFDDLMRGDD